MVLRIPVAASYHMADGVLQGPEPRRVVPPPLQSATLDGDAPVGNYLDSMNGVEFTNDVADAPPSDDPGRVTVPDVAGGADEEIALQRTTGAVSPAMQAFDDTIERDPRMAYQQLQQTTLGLLTKLKRLKEGVNIDDPTSQEEYRNTRDSLTAIALGLINTTAIKVGVTNPLESFMLSKLKPLLGQIQQALHPPDIIDKLPNGIPASSTEPILDLYPSSAGVVHNLGVAATEDAMRYGGEIPTSTAKALLQDVPFGTMEESKFSADYNPAKVVAGWGNNVTEDTQAFLRSGGAVPEDVAAWGGTVPEDVARWMNSGGDLQSILSRAGAGFAQGSPAVNDAADAMVNLRATQAAGTALTTAEEAGTLAKALPVVGWGLHAAMVVGSLGVTAATDGAPAGYLEWGVDMSTLGLYGIAKRIGGAVAAGDTTTPAGQLRAADYAHSMRLYTSDQERQSDKTHAPQLPKFHYYDDPTMYEATQAYRSTDVGANHLKTILGMYGNMILSDGTKGRSTDVTLDDMVDKFATYARGKIFNAQDITNLWRRFYAPSFLKDDPTDGGRQTDKWLGWLDGSDATANLVNPYTAEGRQHAAQVRGLGTGHLLQKGEDWWVGSASMAKDEMTTAYLIGTMGPQLFVQHATAALSNGLFQQYANAVLNQTLYRPIPNMTANDFVRPTASPWFADAAKGLSSRVPPSAPGVSLPAWDPNVNEAIYKIVAADPDFQQRQRAGSTTDWVGFYNQNKQRILAGMYRDIQDALHQQAADHVTDLLPRFAPIMASSPGVVDIAYGHLTSTDPVAALLPTATNAGAGIRIAIDPETRMRVTDLTTCVMFSKLAYVNFVGDGLHPEWAAAVHQGWSIPLAVQGGAFGEHRAVLSYHTGDNTLVVAFRGTVGSLQGAANWFKNLQAWKKTVIYSKTGVAAHEATDVKWAKDRQRLGLARGFWTAWKDLRDQLIPAFHQMFQAPHMRRNLRPRVLVTGHSLGSAMAACCLLELPPQAKPIYYGFGTPRVGDEAFTRAVDGITDGHYYRLCNASDPVTHVPPKAFGFKHAGTAMQFLPSNDGIFKYFDDTDDDPTYHDTVKASAANHDIKLYESNVQIVARNTPSQLFLHRTREFAHYFEPRNHVAEDVLGDTLKTAKLAISLSSTIGKKRAFSALMTQMVA